MITYNVAAWGLKLLIIYIVFDLIKNRFKNLPKRIIMYSFLFYALVIVQLTTDGIQIPPSEGHVHLQFIPFQFVGEWVDMYQANGVDWFLLNSMKLYFYNLIMLVPLGVYLVVLFDVNKFKQAFLILLLSTLFIETYQLIFSYFGLIRTRIFDVDDIIQNALGGLFGFWCALLAVKVIKKLLVSMKRGNRQAAL